MEQKMAISTGPTLVTLDFTEIARPQPQKFSNCYFERHFERLRPFGQGAFGEVWCCQDLESKEPCAVKAVRYKGGAGVESQVIREAQVLCALDHPNIVKCSHAWIQPDGPDGGDLTGGSTRASSWPSTPMTPLPPTDAAPHGMPSLRLTEGVVTETLHFTYEATEDSEICFELQDEEGIFAEPQQSNSNANANGLDLGPPRSKSGSADFGSPQAATLFLQMELCKDKTLQHWISEQNGRPDADPEQRYQEAKSILTQCLRALAYLHDHSCVHRDIKPSNLLFGQDDALRLADFGLAKWLEFSAASPRFVRGMNAGTPCYASPEQLAGKPLETSTDLFSLGIVLAELICPVQTQMERTKVLEALKEKRTLPNDSQLADMAVRMTDAEPMQRPSAKDLLMELGEEVPEFDAEHCAEHMASRAKARFTPYDDRRAEVVSGGCAGYAGEPKSQQLPTMVSHMA